MDIKNQFLILGLLLFSSCLRNSNAGFVIIDGVKLPIDGCVESQKRTTEGSLNDSAFCMCLIPKLYNEFKNDPQKLQLLKEGKYDEVSSDRLYKIGAFYSDCLSQSTTDSSVKFKFTPKMKETLRNQMKTKLIEAGMDKTNDLDKYCNCYINGLQNDFTMKEIFDTTANQNDKFQELAEKCSSLSKKQ